MVNRREIRVRLGLERGIRIPEGSWFIGAEHNTCTEQIEWYDEHLIPSGLLEDLEKLRRSLDEASLRHARERCRKFASAPRSPTPRQALDHVIGRSVDFSQARPELGHATNAAALIGRRALTRGVFFDRRLFMISYDPATDPTGEVLERLLLANGPVGAGINLEYYFSTVDNENYGCGSKVTHNVTGTFGIMDGAASDLRTGLPKQMIEIHEAMRLQVIVESTLEMVGEIYGRQPPLQELIGNGWLLVSVIDPETGEISIFDPEQGFLPWDGKVEPLPEVDGSIEWYDGEMEPLSPALGMLTGSNRGEGGERFTARVVFWSVFLSLLLLLALDVEALLTGAPGQQVFGRWLGSGSYQVLISFTLDPLGLAMATLVALLCLLAIRFSVNYMHREAGFQRFFLVLSLFTGAMLLIVMAGNAVLTFIGWELAGVSSYLLIAYAYDRPTATGNATRAFVTNRIGDAGFVLAIALCFLWLGGVEWPTLFAASARLETLSVGLVAFGFLLAALAKSGQLPFAGWIARALEGPTPSSAIFYGAVMVHAGVYLMIRLEPLLQQAPAVLVLLMVIGLATAIYGWLVGLAQTDVKSSLMFSTTAQEGLMFFECGLGWFDLAAWHLAAHAVWRTYQFLHAPAMMDLASRPARPVAPWLAKRPKLYHAALQRFWLDPISDWLLVRPTRSLAQDLRDFDNRVVNRIVGLPTGVSALSSLAQWEERKKGYAATEDDVGRGSGLAGQLLEWVAGMLHWFEEHLVLKGGGEGLKDAIDLIGKYVVLIEGLLSQPRYLLLIIMATFVVII
jgi:NADH:ubiquinone oxidoreductase subunit 5 (subunit L)/multisubunit Na+/H+ antiporter MnhA subunit